MQLQDTVRSEGPSSTGHQMAARKRPFGLDATEYAVNEFSGARVEGGQDCDREDRD